tara:strand:+ start:503 stop:688 length:186 start_codon:yes stop_codon:yes gene_type:complete
MLMSAALIYYINANNVFPGDELKLKGNVVVLMALIGFYPIVKIYNAHMNKIKASRDEEFGY